MRIAHVSPYDHRVAGGVREHVVNLAAHQEAAGHDTTILAPTSTPHAQNGIVPVSRVIVPLPGAQSLARISVSPAVFPRMARLLGRGRFDVVHIHEPLVPTVSLSALWHADAVTVGTIHGYRPRYALYRGLRWPLDNLMSRLSARVAVSVDAREFAARYFPGDYHVIPDGVDVRRFADPKVAPIEWMADGPPTVLFVGRLDRRKGFPVLLDALVEVQRRVPATRLVVVGHFGERERTRAREDVRRRGLRDVVLVGPVDAAQLPRYYRSADVFCAPSTGFEALGIVLLEAMAAGTAIVTTDIPGYRGVVRDRREGVLVPPGDARALAAGLVDLLTRPQRRDQLAAAGCRRVADYAWPRVAERLLDLYAEAGA